MRLRLQPGVQVRLRLPPCAPQATELIVDAALKYGRPFAVVPCCVFPRLFPHRPEVRTTAAFCDYLLRKGAGLEVGFLPVVGRNKVIFRRAAAPPQPERALTIAAVIYTPQSVDHGRLARGTWVEAQPQPQTAPQSLTQVDVIEAELGQSGLEVSVTANKLR